MLKTKLYKNLNRLGQFLFSGALLYIIIAKITNESFQFQWMFDHGYFYLACLALLLVIFNWGLETLKWRRLMRIIQDLDFRTALKSVLFGVSASLFTPNRVGEVAGRLICIENPQRPKAVLINILNASCQLFITILFGGIALIYLWEELVHLLVFESMSLSFMQILIPVGVISLLGVWIFLRAKNRWQEFKNNIRSIWNTLRSIAPKEVMFTLFLSALRYLVFSLQFLCLLYCFGVVIPAEKAWFLIAALFFFNTLVPGGMITELGVRTSLAVFLFGMYSTQISGILAASFSLWIINLAIPATIGLFFVREFKLITIRT